MKFFLENIFSMKNKLSRPICEESPFDSILNKEGSTNAQACDESRRSQTRRKNKSFGDDFYTFLLEDNHKTYKEAMLSIDAPFWKQAINDEMEPLWSIKHG